MNKNDPKKIHFLGIGGSGASAAAVIAKKSGYKVTGCNLKLDTPYIKKVKDYKIKLYEGHDRSHMEKNDLLVTTPAIFFSDNSITELEYARKEKSVTSWQQFVGKYLHNNKKVISVSGTHGKSTTTAMLGLIMENAKLDPTVIVGATVNKWSANFRWGESKYFLIESDEFFNNFHNYTPDYVILNNIEYDHPDFFKTEKSLFSSFEQFVGSIKKGGTLIANQDSDGVLKLLNSLNKTTLKKLKVVGYTLKSKKKFTFLDLYKASNIKFKKGVTKFKASSTDGLVDHNFELQIPGSFNVSNALGAIVLADLLGVDPEKISEALSEYDGIGRRQELIGEIKGIKVFDDYAHHPTAIRSTLSALKQKLPNGKLVAVIEPHSYSRTKALLDEYEDVFDAADKVYIGKIYKARDNERFGMTGEDIVEVSKHPDIQYVQNTNKLINEIIKNVSKGDQIIVMGAGNSYKWARDIIKLL